MRIAYVAEWAAFPVTGVLKKMWMQVTTWRELGHEAELFLVSPPPLGGSNAPKHHIISCPATRLLPGGKVRTYANKVLCAPALWRALRAYRPDAVYYRQGIWYPGLLWALRAAPVVVEVNSKDTEEIRLFGPVKSRVHLVTRGGLLRCCAGVVAVTPEIAGTLVGLGKPVCVVTNGFDVGSVHPRVPPPGTRPRLVFVGSPGYPWHGVDRVVALAELLPEFDFHVVGETPLGRYPGNVTFHGYLQGDELGRLYQEMHVGLGSLALWRSNLSQACPLKVREYLAYGLPVIIAHEDPDLEDCPYVLKIPCDPDNVERNVDTIREFVYKWAFVSIDREDVVRRIDCRVKEAERLRFIASIVYSANSRTGKR